MLGDSQQFRVRVGEAGMEHPAALSLCSQPRAAGTASAPQDTASPVPGASCQAQPNNSLTSSACLSPSGGNQMFSRLQIKVPASLV